MRTAVLITGFLRTWKICKDVLLDSLTDVYGDNIDFYMVVWNTKTATEDEIRTAFVDKKLNLIQLEMIDPDHNYIFPVNVPDCANQVSDSVASPARLRAIASRIKRLHEFKNDICYQRVIWSRPDVIYYYNHNAPHKENTFEGDPNDFMMQIRGDFIETSYELISPHTHDVMPITGLLSSDLYGFMYIDINDSHSTKKIRLGADDTHALISYFLNRHLITLDNRFLYQSNKINYIAPVVIRPSSDFKKFFSENKKWDQSFISAGAHDRVWETKNNYHERIEWIKAFNIDLRDYGF